MLVSVIGEEEDKSETVLGVGSSASSDQSHLSSLYLLFNPGSFEFMTITGQDFYFSFSPGFLPLFTWFD